MCVFVCTVCVCVLRGINLLCQSSPDVGPFQQHKLGLSSLHRALGGRRGVCEGFLEMGGLVAAGLAASMGCSDGEGNGDNTLQIS